MSYKSADTTSKISKTNLADVQKMPESLLMQYCPLMRS